MNKGRESLDVSPQAQDQSDRDPLKKQAAGHQIFLCPRKSADYTPSIYTTLSTTELNSKYLMSVSPTNSTYQKEHLIPFLNAYGELNYSFLKSLYNLSFQSPHIIWHRIRNWKWDFPKFSWKLSSEYMLKSPVTVDYEVVTVLS